MHEEHGGHDSCWRNLATLEITFWGSTHDCQGFVNPTGQALTLNMPDDSSVYEGHSTKSMTVS